MDASLKSIPLNKENIYNIFNEILNIELNDNINFEILDIKDIRSEDEYGGFRINVLGKFEKLKVNMFIEVSTGDIITPKEIEYKYNCIFENKKISIFAYTVETIIAEKFETIITRSILNTRLKDFYDFYVLFNKEINKDKILDAVKNTFTYRETLIDTQNFRNVINLIENDNFMNNNWLKYSKKYIYAKDIDFGSIIHKLNELIDILEEMYTIV